VSESGWSPEGWAWAQIREGKVADFNDYFGRLDPKDPKGWTENRRLGKYFLQQLFTTSSQRDGIPPEGVRICGAYLPEGQLAQYTYLTRQVWLQECRSDSAIDFTGVRASGTLSLQKSYLGKTGNYFIAISLDLRDSSIQGDLDLDFAMLEGDLFIQDAAVVGSICLIGSKISRRVHGPGLRVGQDMLMGHPYSPATFGRIVDLQRSKIAGHLNMAGSNFSREVNYSHIQIGGDLIVGNVGVDTEFGETLHLTNSKIDGTLQLDGSKFNSSVNGDSLHVGRHLFMRDASFRGSVELRVAKVEGIVDISNSEFDTLNLSGAAIALDFSLVGPLGKAKWRHPNRELPSILLRNTTALALRDTPDSWPNNIDIEGFTYTHLGAFGGPEAGDARDRSVGDWKAWLAKDRSGSKTYGPRPYAHLSSVLAAVGRRDQAQAIQFAGRERERVTSLRQGRLGRWMWLTILAYVCGYGIGGYTFRVLWWIGGAVLLGTTILWEFTPAAHAKGLIWCFGASLARMLPIVQLNKEFADFFDDPDRIRLSGWLSAFFDGLGLLGWVLGSFLVAALSGLTQKS
jgi:cytoskeletal protein CcmA (bactofilin family)